MAIAAALVLELLLLLLLLSLDRWTTAPEDSVTVVPFNATSEAAESAEETPADEAPAPERAEVASPTPAPRVEAPPETAPVPVMTAAQEELASFDLSKIRSPAPRPAPAPSRPLIGPPDTGTPGDTERVGTAPNGEPLYAAAWYRKPYDDELQGYLSTATGPGWGLIACRTAPDFRVEDCVALSEYPKGSNINRAILAAAWQFKVRPPRLGGRSLVGAWVRIRFDYTMERP